MTRRSFVPLWLESAAAWSWRLILVGAVILFAVLALSRIQVVVVPVAIALLLSSVLRPPALALRRRRVPWPLSVMIVFLVGVLAGVGLIMLIAPSFASQFSKLGPAISDGLQEIRDWLREGIMGLSPAGVDSVLSYLQERLGQSFQSLSQSLLSPTLGLEIATGIVLTLILTFFFVKDGSTLWGWIIEIVSSERRATVDAVGVRSLSSLAAFLRGAAIVGTVDAAIIGIGLLILGVPLILPLMVLTFFAAFFPIVGAIAAGAVAVLVAFVSGGWSMALFTLVLVIIVQQIDGNVLAPLVYGRAVRLHPVVVLLVITTGGTVGGIVGAFIAVPLTAVIWTGLRELAHREVIELPSGSARADVVGATRKEDGPEGQGAPDQTSGEDRTPG